MNNKLEELMSAAKIKDNNCRLLHWLTIILLFYFFFFGAWHQILGTKFQTFPLHPVVNIIIAITVMIDISFLFMKPSRIYIILISIWFMGGFCDCLEIHQVICI